MTIANFSLAEASLAQIAPQASSKKPPPKRTSVPLPDRKLAPEPR